MAQSKSKLPEIYELFLANLVELEQCSDFSTGVFDCEAANLNIG